MHGKQVAATGRGGLAQVDPRFLKESAEQNAQPRRCFGMIGSGIVLEAVRVGVDRNSQPAPLSSRSGIAAAPGFLPRYLAAAGRCLPGDGGTSASTAGRDL